MVNTNMTKNMDTECTSGQMVAAMKGFGLTESKKTRDLINLTLTNNNLLILSFSH